MRGTGVTQLTAEYQKWLVIHNELSCGTLLHQARNILIASLSKYGNALDTNKKQYV